MYGDKMPYAAVDSLKSIWVFSDVQCFFNAYLL